jgi:hypothetical protein
MVKHANVFCQLEQSRAKLSADKMEGEELSILPQKQRQPAR